MREPVQTLTETGVQMRILQVVLLLVVTFASRAFAEPAQVIIIRHGEKPHPEGHDLSLKGRERAAALAPYFMKDPDVLDFGPPVALYAQTRPNESSLGRPIETVTPLAEALHLKINDSFKRDDFKDMMKEIKHEKKYEGHTVLICWEHHKIPDIAAAFGADDAPKKFHDVYDRTWVLTFKDGECTFENLPQKLMFGDSNK